MLQDYRGDPLELGGAPSPSEDGEDRGADSILWEDDGPTRLALSRAALSAILLSFTLSSMAFGVGIMVAEE